MLASGDKMIVTKNTSFLNKGDIIEVTDVEEEFGVFSFVFYDDPTRKGMMSISMCEEHFEKIIEEKKDAPSITSEMINEIILNSDVEVYTVFGKCTIVACRLPNGFVIIESSACVSPENYDKEIGIDICLNKIKDKIWELEGYRLQNELYEADDDCFCGNGCCCNCCNECEEIDECLDTDLDCDDCKDFGCRHNTNINL